MWTNSTFASLKTVSLIKTRLVSNQFSSEIGAAQRNPQNVCVLAQNHIDTHTHTRINMLHKLLLLGKLIHKQFINKVHTSVES